MKMNRALSLAMAGALGLSLLAGCGGGSGSATPAPADTSAPADHSGASGVIKIGGIGPLTGSAAVYGLATKQGAEVAVAEINALGGLQFSLDFQDDEGDAEKAVNAYNKLKGDGVQLIYGCTTTTPCVAVAAETFNDRYFQLTPSASSTDVTSGRDNVFQVCFTDPNQGLTAANYIKENGLGTKVAVIYNNGDAYSTGIYNAFQSEADAIGLEVVSVTTFPDDTNADFTVQLGEAQSAGADLVFMPIYYQPASIILAQAKAMGYAPTFFGVDGMDGILTAENFDASLAEGVYLLTPFSADSEDEMTQNFVAEYQDRFGEIPNQFSAAAYDDIYTLYQAIQAAGATADMSNEEICDALIEVMPTLAVTGLTSAGSEMTWDENGAVSKDPTAVIIENGTYVTP